MDGWEDRPDCTVVDVPQDCVGYITGSRRCALNGTEAEFGVVAFFMSKPSDRRGEQREEKLLISGPQWGRRAAELNIMRSIEAKTPGYFTRGLRDKESCTVLELGWLAGTGSPDYGRLLVLNYAMRPAVFQVSAMAAPSNINFRTSESQSLDNKAQNENN